MPICLIVSNTYSQQHLHCTPEWRRAHSFVLVWLWGGAEICEEESGWKKLDTHGDKDCEMKVDGGGVCQHR